MSVHTTMTMARGGNPTILTPFAVQVDTMEQQEASYWGGDGPHFRYDIYVQVPNTFQEGDFLQRDLLIDQVNIDPVTGTNKQYRVISDPARFFDGHIEMVADRYRGT